MSLLKRFTFWLPLLSLINYIGKLIFNPVKDLVFVLDCFIDRMFRQKGKTC